VLYGVTAGNLVRGVPIDRAGNWAGTFLGLLNPYSLLVGALVLAAFVMHGALWMRLKTDGAQAERMRAWAMRGWLAWGLLLVAATVLTGFVAPERLKPGNPLLWVFAALLLGGLVAMPLLLRSKKLLPAFLASGGALAGMVGQAAVGLFPNMLPSSINPAFSLTITNAASTPKTLTVMLVIALVGMPLVLAYTTLVYWVFRGKVRLESQGY